jgi:predicted patatin/cPLA2 family phospholipase
LPEPTHPVLELIRRRAESGSEPGARRDDARLALVVEGGGMRGVVSAGMTAALERLGLTPCFDLVVGASAGAINGAALLGGVAQEGAAMYHGPLASRSFVNPARVLRGRPVIDVNYVLQYASGGLDQSRHDRVVEGAAAIHCVATAIETAEPVVFSGMRTREELWQAILASTRMPWAGGAPVEIDGRRYVDGGLGAPIPVAQAIAGGATHVLALQTRPFDVPRKSASRIGDRFIERHLRKLNPALVTLYRDRIAGYEQVVQDIAARSSEPGDRPPYVLGVRPAAGTPCVGQLERRAPILAAAAVDAERLVERALATTAALRPATAG